MNFIYTFTVKICEKTQFFIYFIILYVNASWMEIFFQNLD